MRIFDNLKENQAVLIEDGKYLVCLPDGVYMRNDTDVRFEIVGGSSYSGYKQIVIPTISISRITKSPTYVIGYVDREGNPVGSVDEHTKLNKQLRDYQDRIDNGGKVDLDHEYDIRRQLQKYDGVKDVRSEPEEVINEVSIEVVGTWIDTDSAFILTSYEVGSTNFTWGGTGPFKVLTSAIALDELEKQKVKHPTITNSTHSNVRYAQFGNSYIFNSDEENKYVWLKKPDAVSITKELDTAKTIEKEIRAFVRSKVNMCANPVTVDDMSYDTVTQIIAEVSNALGAFNNVDASKKTTNYLIQGKQKLRDVMTKLRKIHE